LGFGHWVLGFEIIFHSNWRQFDSYSSFPFQIHAIQEFGFSFSREETVWLIPKNDPRA